MFPKTVEEIRGHVFGVVDKIVQRGFDALVIACNTAISIAIDDLQNKLGDVSEEKYGCIVLGCTHFVYYVDMIQEMFPNVKVINGNRGTVERLKEALKEI